jgi:ABC-type uncharacterized transport system auxiliary subunit
MSATRRYMNVESRIQNSEGRARSPLRAAFCCLLLALTLAGCATPKETQTMELYLPKVEYAEP